MQSASFFNYRARVRYRAILCCFAVVVLTVQIALVPFAVSAQGANVGIDYNQIISDDELIDYQSMSEADIQQFLELKKSILATFYVTLDTGETVRASQIVYRASQTHRINPRFLLVLVQKEESLIEDPSPTNNQLDWATGYGCLDGQPCNERWRGLAKQVNSAAEQFRYYYEHIGEYNYQPGKSSYVDGMLVTPRNLVTAALYNYTPHLHGNELFKTLWHRYFGTPYPDGTLLQGKGEVGVWLVQNGVKRAFTSRIALVSRYNPDLVVTVDTSKLNPLPRGLDITFAAYSLLRNTKTGDTYLLTVDQKRRIVSPEVFKQIGFNPEEVQDATDEQLAAIPDGKPVTFEDAYPTGALLQDKTSAVLFYVEGTRRYPVLHKDIAAINYPGLKIVKTTPEKLSQYPSGFPILLKDGILVKGRSAEVYVISNQKKRLITSEKAFNAIGYKWNSIVVTTDEVLAMHPTGDPILPQ